MPYLDYESYKSIYGDDSVSESDFNRLLWDACKKIDILTSGVDGVKKLQVAFPVSEYDSESVKRCVGALIKISAQIENSEKTLLESRGYVTREDGTVTSKIVSSVSAGNESISYYTGGVSSQATLIDKALADTNVKKQIFRDIITEHLSGIKDANGVSLLFMGRYPYKLN